MILGKCRECKEEVLKNAKVCPHCGVKNPVISNLDAFLGLGAIIMICVAIYYFFSGDDEKKSATKETTVKTVSTPAPKPFKYADMTLKEYRNEYKGDRKEIVEKYIAFKNIVGQETDGFYSCLSQMSYTKSDELKLGEVLGWCYRDYAQNPASLSKYINFDEYRSKFDIWNGSYRPLEKIIKESMHDESSYKHIETLSRRVLSGDHPYAVVKTIYSGTNLYGARVKQYAAVKVDIKTGEIIEFITEE
ncbi:hypothetical protein ACP179_12210 [Xenorhabdus stockiae]|uniref:hypothetical protein n=1 Tax=Xenorhabdus stockiae TaxID=351614 RepID=UPI003CF83676